MLFLFGALWMVDGRCVGALCIAESSCIFRFWILLPRSTSSPRWNEVSERKLLIPGEYLIHLTCYFWLRLSIPRSRLSYIYKVVVGSCGNNPLTPYGLFFSRVGVFGRKALRQHCQRGWENLRPFPASTCEFPPGCPSLHSTRSAYWPHFIWADITSAVVLPYGIS